MSDQRLFGNLFLSIGAMKAGTTWLYAVLNRHPELHFTTEKELHYFYHRYVDANLLSDQRRLENAKNRYLTGFDPNRANIDIVRLRLHWVSAYLSRPVDDHWYRNLFDLRNQQKYGCDFSNLNAHIPADIWPRIEAGCDQLRILYTMRDPIKRLWSHTKFHLQVTNKVDLLDSWGPKDFLAFAKQPFIWDNAEYGKVLQRLQTGVSAGKWKAIFFEDLHADQMGVLREIEDFLEISHHTYPEAVLKNRQNASVRHPMPEFFPELFAEDVARIRAEVEDAGFTLPDSWG